MSACRQVERPRAAHRSGFQERMLRGIRNGAARGIKNATARGFRNAWSGDEEQIIGVSGTTRSAKSLSRHADQARFAPLTS